MFEIACGIILSLLVDNKHVSNTNWGITYNKVLLLNANNIDVELIKLFIHKNNRTCAQIYILSNDKDELSYKLGYEADTNIINNVSEITNDKTIIELNINQYIKCKDPEDFDLNKYTIENIK